MVKRQPGLILNLVGTGGATAVGPGPIIARVK